MPEPENIKPNTVQHRAKKNPWQRRLRYFYIRFIRLRGHPREIARGLAAGVFAGSFPLFGIQTILGIAIAAGIRGNKLMAAAGTWISNPFTYVPIYAFNYQLGRWILQQPPQPNLFTSEQSFQHMMDLGLDITIALFLGSTIVGVILGSVSYYVGLTMTKRVRKLRQKRAR